MDDQPVFVAAEIKDDPIVAYEIDGVTKLPLYFGRIRRTRRAAISIRACPQNI
jgi:hypothetical protein